MISRRSFLVGLGAIVTSGFVKDARAHARRAGRPLLIEPVRPQQTLYLYENPDQEEVERICEDLEVDPEDPVDGFYWADLWEYSNSPCARAYVLLDGLDLDCALDARGRKAGFMEFTEWGGHPGSSERWVDLPDDLSVSILQGRLVERRLPIEVVIGDLRDV